MKKKILLLFPNTGNEGVMPLAAAILSTIAKQAGFDLRYFETSFYKKRGSATEEREQWGEFKPFNRENICDMLPYERLKIDFQDMLLDYKPDILAVSANSLEYELFGEMMEGAKFSGVKPLVIIGGVHATVAPEDVIRSPHVDAICIGEGEAAWEDFLLKLKSGGDIAGVKNLWVKTSRGIIKNPLGRLLEEEKLWAKPLDFSFFDKRHFLKPFDGKLYHRGQIELSRGCPYNCTYCVNSGFKNIYKGLGKFFRIRPFDNLREAIITQAELGAEMMQFQDECFFSAPINILKEFYRWYSSKIKIPLLLQTRPETVDEDKVKLLAEMDIPVQISLGVESGSGRILRDICNRATSIGEIKNAFGIISKYKLRSTAYTMIGFPTETRQEAFETIRLIRELRPDTSIMSVFYPFKGTPLRDYCIKNGYIAEDERARTFTDMPVLKNQPMSAEEVYNLRRTYSLYTRLPEEYFPKVELCERDYEKHKDLFNDLVSLMTRSYYKSWDLK